MEPPSPRSNLKFNLILSIMEVYYARKSEKLT